MSDTPIERLWIRSPSGTVDNPFANLSDYDLRNLAAHLEMAGRVEDLHRILALETDGGQNAWYEIREHVGDSRGFLADVTRAWLLAEATGMPGEIATTVGWQCRYALITASLNSLANNIPIDLLTALVDYGQWPPDESLSYTLQIPDTKQRIGALLAIALRLSPSLRRQALTVLLSLDDEYRRLAATVDLVQQLADGGWPDEALCVVQTVADPAEQALLLHMLAPHLAESWLYQALAVARGLENAEGQAQAVVELALHLPAPLTGDVAHQAIVAAQAIASGTAGPFELASMLEAMGQANVTDMAGSLALARIATHLPTGQQEEMLRQAVALAQAIEDVDRQAEALVELVPYLSEPLKGAVLNAALKAIAELEYKGNQPTLLARLAPHLSEPRLRQVMSAAWTAKDQVSPAQILAAIASSMTPTLREEALREILGKRRRRKHKKGSTPLYEDDEWAEALAALVPDLPDSLKEYALLRVLVLEDNKRRLRGLLALAPHLPGHLWPPVLQAVKAVSDTFDRAEVLEQLAPSLPITRLQEALHAAQTIDDAYNRERPLAVLAVRIAELGAPEQAVALAGSLHDEYKRAFALEGIASHLTPSSVEQALATALATEGQAGQSRALAAVAPRLAALGKPHLAVQAVLAIEPPHDRASAVEKVAPQLAGLGYPDQALAITQAISPPAARAAVLARLVPMLPEAWRQSVLTQALTASRTIGDTWARVQMLVALLPHLSAAFCQQALEIVLVLLEPGMRARALAALAPYLTEPQRGETLNMVFTAAQAIDDERMAVLVDLAPHLTEPLLSRTLEAVLLLPDLHRRVDYLARLGPYLSRPLLSRAVAAGLEIEPAFVRRNALVALAPYIGPLGPLPAVTLPRLLSAVDSLNAGDMRTLVLAELAPYLSHQQRRRAMYQSMAIRDNKLRAQALIHLARYLPEPLRGKAIPQALAAASSVQGEDQRASLLIQLTPLLPPSLLPQALTQARGLEMPDERARVLIGLMPRLAPALQEQVLKESVAAAQDIENPLDCGWMFVRLMPHLPLQWRSELLPQALAAVLRIETDDERQRVLEELDSEQLATVDIVDKGARKRVLAALARHLARLPPAALYSLWSKTLHELKTHTRRDLLADLGAFAPVITALGGEAAAAQSFQALQDVGRWWP